MLRIASTVVASFLVAFLLVACDAPQSAAPRAPVTLSRDLGGVADTSLVRQVRMLAAQRGIGPMPAPPQVRRPLVVLGQALAFDPILSGSRDMACMTCHLPAYASTDGRSLSVGEGGTGLGPARTHPQGIFIPRNAPSAFNLYALKKLFWDGRVEVDAAGHYHTPAGAQLTLAMTRVFEFGAASAQPLFPVAARAEMRGNTGPLGTMPDTDFTDIWSTLMGRLGQIPEYRAMFEAAYPGTRFEDMNFAYASNAIAGFLIAKLAFVNSPWDRFLAGDDGALTEGQLEGARDFLALKCSICHNGAALSDEQFHDVVVPQIGPGEGNGPTGRDDFGRFNVTGDPADMYRFRTTPLRNVELTAPYGHDGAIVDLRAFVAHYSNSDQALLAYDPTQLETSLQGTVMPNATALMAQRDTLLNGVVLSDSIVDRLTDYMRALTDAAARDLSRIAPQRVPSGLPLYGSP